MRELVGVVLLSLMTACGTPPVTDAGTVDAGACVPGCIPEDICIRGVCVVADGGIDAGSVDAGPGDAVPAADSGDVAADAGPTDGPRTCAAGERLCGGVCVNLHHNCNACGSDCYRAEQVRNVPGCVLAPSDGGTCAPIVCENGWGDCDSNPANGCEVDLRDNPAHCWACAATCSAPTARCRFAGGLGECYP